MPGIYEREIKFRAWDKCQQKMYRWEPSFFGDCVFGMSGDDYIAMQFTNCKDEDGKEIYEKDVVSVTNGHMVNEIGIVEFSVSGFYVCEEDGRWAESLQEGNIIKKLGNIYENPELLK